ncbi:MAG TPA: hypothetical protein VGQ04_00940 [Chitinophagaceae bacterium]|jgi:hypothetical protein|nr:hypothetical protein [Chitinophagaceae bacterium]
MSKILVVLAMILLTGIHGLSQCDKKIKWNSSKAEMYDTNGALLDTKTGIITVETDQEKISLSFKESTEKGLEGTIKEKTCDWKEAFSNGKTVYHTTVNVDGKISDAIFTVEAKDGKTTITLAIEMMAGRKFLIYIDTYEVVK